MLPFGLPKLSFDPVLFVPLWTGSLRDYSGSNINVANVGGSWLTSGFRDGWVNNGNEWISASSASCEDVIDLTFFVFTAGRFRGQENNQFLIRTVSGGRVWFYLLESHIVLFDDTSPSLVLNDVSDAYSLAVSATRESGKPSFYKNGNFIGLGSVNTSMQVSSCNWRIWGSSATPTPHVCSGFIIYPGIIPASEMPQLHDWCMQTKTPRKQWPGFVSLPGRPPLQTGDPVYVDNISSARVSLKDETAGTLSNTTFTIESGTWRQKEDANERFIECLSTGKITDQVLGASSAVTKKFEYTGTASITKTNNQIQIDASAGARIKAVELAAA